MRGPHSSSLVGSDVNWFYALFVAIEAVTTLFMEMAGTRHGRDG